MGVVGVDRPPTGEGAGAVGGHLGVGAGAGAGPQSYLKHSDVTKHYH